MVQNFSAYTKYITEGCLIYVAGVKLRKGCKKKKSDDKHFIW